MSDMNQAICRWGRILCIFGGTISFIVAAYLALFIATVSFGAPFSLGLGVCFFIYGGLLWQAERGKYLLALRWVNRLLSLGIASFLILEFFVLQGMKTDLPTHCRYVIVLGAGLTGDYPSQTLQERLDAALVVLRENPEARAIASGGVGKESIYSEASVMKWYLVERGIAADRIVEEDKATRTDENLQFGKKAIKERYGEDIEELIIATSDYHMFRSKLLAKKYFKNVYGICAASPIGIRINYALREYFALVKMGALEGYDWVKKTAGAPALGTHG